MPQGRRTPSLVLAGSLGIDGPSAPVASPLVHQVQAEVRRLSGAGMTRRVRHTPGLRPATAAELNAAGLPAAPFQRIDPVPTPLRDRLVRRAQSKGVQTSTASRGERVEGTGAPEAGHDPLSGQRPQVPEARVPSQGGGPSPDSHSASDRGSGARANVARTAGPPTATGGRPASSAASLDATRGAGTVVVGTTNPVPVPLVRAPESDQLQAQRAAARARQAHIDAVLARVNTNKPRSGR